MSLDPLSNAVQHPPQANTHTHQTEVSDHDHASVAQERLSRVPT